MNLIQSLKNLNLNEKEAKVYLALLQLGKTTSYAVAKLSNLKKPTTYVILDQLIDKGFAYKIPRAKKQLYQAESPEKCLAIAKEKLKLTAQTLPELQALQKKKEEKVSVAYYEGINGIKEMYEKMFKILKKRKKEKRELIGFFATSQNIPDDLENVFKNMRRKLKEYHIKMNGITVFDKSNQEYFKESFLIQYANRFQLKGIPFNKYSSSISIEVYDNFVNIFSHRHIQAVTIENPDVAKAMRQIFKMNWNLIEKDKKNYLKASTLQ